MRSRKNSSFSSIGDLRLHFSYIRKDPNSTYLLSLECCQLPYPSHFLTVPTHAWSQKQQQRLDTQLSVSWNTLNFGKVPFLVAQGTDAASLEPALDAVQVKHVTAVTKSNR